MKIAYLVVAHSNPKLIEKTVSRLLSNESGFFIHIDAKVDIQMFCQITGSNIFFLPERFVVHWAEYGLVRAILALISAALTSKQHYEYLVLLSGSDYPVRSRDYVQAFFERNNGLEFINAVSMPNNLAGKPLSHIDAFHMPSSRPISRAGVKVLARIGLAKRDHRRHLGGLIPFGGDTWWALTRATCAHILKFVREHDDFVQFFTNVPSPEEIFFPTIVGNSRVRTKIRRSLLYADWSRGDLHPEMIAERHLSLFEGLAAITPPDVFGSGEVLFARKFSDESLTITERIDEMIGVLS